MHHNHTPASRTCKACGGPITNSNETYCSLACKHAYRGIMPDLKKCAACGEVMQYRPGEPPHKYRLRKTCNRKCSFVLTGMSQTIALPSKACSVCGATIQRRPGEHSGSYRNRKTCSHECKVAQTAIGRRARFNDTKVCVVCGETFARGEKETPSNFLKRRACGRECGYKAAAMTKRINAPAASPYPQKFNDALKEAIRERDAHVCRLCGGTSRGRKLHVHHINYNKQDCRPSNLLSLCASCHGKTHVNRDYWFNVFTRLMPQE